MAKRYKGHVNNIKSRPEGKVRSKSAEKIQRTTLSSFAKKEPVINKNDQSRPTQ